MIGCSAFVLGVDVQVTRVEDSVIYTAAEISYNMIQCSVIMLGEDEQVTRVDD